MSTTALNKINIPQTPLSIMPKEKSTREIVREEIKRAEKLKELEQKHQAGEISDFEYNIDRHGRPYGWGVARYTSPEVLYGRQDAGCTPEESYRQIYGHLRSLLPGASEKKLQELIG